MTNDPRVKGIVIKTKDYSENASLVTFLTKDSLISLIVRGAKKINSKTRSYAQVLTLLQFEQTTNRSLNTLTRAEIIDSFIEIRNDLQRLSVADAILEKIIYASNEEMNFIILFDFLLILLDHLKTTSHPEVILAIFELKYLYLLGINPQFTNCIHCGKAVVDGVFSIEAAGIICPEAKKIYHGDLSSSASSIMKYLYLIKMEKIDEQFLSHAQIAIADIAPIIDRYYARYLEFYSKTKAIYRHLAK